MPPRRRHVTVHLTVIILHLIIVEDNIKVSLQYLMKSRYFLL